MIKKSLLHIVVALHCEAKPIINYFKLKKIITTSSPFPIFSSQDKKIHLIVSGVGKIKTSSAVTYLALFTGHLSYACYLNVGIAGALSFQRGEAVLVNKIIEKSTEKAWYPYTQLLNISQQEILYTYDVPQNQYTTKGLMDMEGSAFFQTASLFVTQEQIQILKIISDNSVNDQLTLTPVAAERLISEKMDKVVEVANYLLNLSEQEALLCPDMDLLSQFKVKWHFTHSQTLQLNEILRKWKIHFDSSPFVFCQEEKRSQKVIDKLLSLMPI